MPVTRQSWSMLTEPVHSTGNGYGELQLGTRRTRCVLVPVPDGRLRHSSSLEGDGGACGLESLTGLVRGLLVDLF
jgi:hypothetical protein